MVGRDSIAEVRTTRSLGYGAILCIVDGAGLPYTQLKTTMEKREQLLLDYDSYKRKARTHAALLRRTSACAIVSIRAVQCSAQRSAAQYTPCSTLEHTASPVVLWGTVGYCGVLYTPCSTLEHNG